MEKKILVERVFKAMPGGFEIWAGSTGVCQAVYIENLATRTFRVVFIDNGHLFGGPNWEFSLKPGSEMCLETEIYCDLLNPQIIEAWIGQIRNEAIQHLPNLLKTIPKQWYKGDIVRLQETLRSRAMSLRTLFWNEIATLKEPLRNSFRGVYESLSCPPFFRGGIE